MPLRLDLLSALAERIVLFDGAMGTLLIASGLGPGQAPEAFGLERPDVVRRIHDEYLDAGAEVVQTNTFGGNRLKLGDGLDVDEVNGRMAEIALSAAREHGRGALVAGDIGPTGRFFPPVGDLTPEAARDAFREQAGALERAGVDLFLVETMVDLTEAACALRAVREVSSKPVLVTLTFDRKPRGYFTMMGDTPAAAAEALVSDGADGVGANCTLGPSGMADLAAQYRAATDAPLVFQPNDGAEFAEEVGRIASAGASAVGGCCGTTPEDIRAIARVLGGERR